MKKILDQEEDFEDIHIVEYSYMDEEVQVPNTLLLAYFFLHG